jgi:hypothetical protein
VNALGVAVVLAALALLELEHGLKVRRERSLNGSSASDVLRRGETMGQECESTAAEGERLTALRDAAEKGSSEHRELNHQLIKARRRLYEVEWGKRGRGRR